MYSCTYICVYIFYTQLMYMRMHTHNHSHILAHYTSFPFRIIFSQMFHIDFGVYECTNLLLWRWRRAGETVSEIIDWTQFRHDPGWTPEMFRAFEKLTASCPGYMGKSQMVEFVKEIHKLFQPQISELRRGRDRLRGRKAGPKEGITQLGTVNRDVAMRAAEGDDFQAVPGDLALDAMEEVGSSSSSNMLQICVSIRINMLKYTYNICMRIHTCMHVHMHVFLGAMCTYFIGIITFLNLHVFILDTRLTVSAQR